MGNLGFESRQSDFQVDTQVSHYSASQNTESTCPAPSIMVRMTIKHTVQGLAQSAPSPRGPKMAEGHSVRMTNKIHKYS